MFTYFQKNDSKTKNSENNSNCFLLVSEDTEIFNALQCLDLKNYSDYPIGKNNQDSTYNANHFLQMHFMPFLENILNQKALILKIQNIKVHNRQFFQELFLYPIENNYVEKNFFKKNLSIQHLPRQTKFVQSILSTLA